ncbi:MAG: response regulator [Pirellulales bacterium]|nr:response regulator [Pirellulales bacterium]
MPKKLLSVGNCSFDDSEIRRMVRDHFDAEIVRASTSADALLKLRNERFDLVLVNRTIRGDQGGGVELIRRIKSDPELSCTAIMLVSNYPDYQQAAIAEGAEPGFGKSELDLPATVERLRRFLE